MLSVAKVRLSEYKNKKNLLFVALSSERTLSNDKPNKAKTNFFVLYFGKKS